MLVRAHSLTGVLWRSDRDANASYSSLYSLSRASLAAIPRRSRLGFGLTNWSSQILPVFPRGKSWVHKSFPNVFYRLLRTSGIILSRFSTSSSSFSIQFPAVLCRFALKMAKKEVVHTDDLLTHPQNRGSLLINPRNAHRNGSLIRRVGANV